MRTSLLLGCSLEVLSTLSCYDISPSNSLRRTSWLSLGQGQGRRLRRSVVVTGASRLLSVGHTASSGSCLSLARTTCVRRIPARSNTHATACEPTVCSIDLNMDGLLDNAVMCGVDLETLLSALPNVDFRAVDIFSNSTEAADARALLLQADIVFVDTAHLGDFEADVYTFLHDHGFRGLLLLDDIHWTSNPAMEVLWQTVITHPNKLDLTSIGHSSGTGAVNFGGRLELLPFEVERV
mmetsp:Transcript_19782/g.47223  ORF Transcript_19782/g.47223 Transcript_19782/m.47223 type:complete len:238 (+) Transcript_19782:1447-2160(+)